MAKRVVLLCVLLGCMGCDLFQPKQTVQNYFPLAIGNRWTYRGPGGSTEEVEITESRLNDEDVRVYAWESSGSTMWASNAGSTVNMREEPDEEGDVWLSEPFEVGVTWDMNLYTKCRIDDVDAEVSVDAGEFKDCIAVQLIDEESGDLMGTFYFAPGVGLVRMATYGGATAMELIDYEIK